VSPEREDGGVSYNRLVSVVEPPAEALKLLSPALPDPEPLVRGHAASALGRGAGARANELLASESESDPWVAEEVETARSRVRINGPGEAGRWPHGVA